MKQWIAIAVVSVAAWGCKQGQGERCQVNADCANGLICTQAEPRTCGGNNSNMFDADLPEAGAPDAPIDAAPIDAAPIDAAPIDAAP